MTLFRGLGATSYTSQVQALAPLYGVPPSLAVAVMNAESSGNPNAVSSAGAQGLFQLMPATAASVGVSNSFDPTQNINGGLKYLQQMCQATSCASTGNWNDALVAYNEGPGAFAASGAYPSSAAYASGILSAAGLDSSSSGDSSASDGTNSANTDLTAWVTTIPAVLDLSAATGLSWGVLGGIAAGLLGLSWVVKR